MRTLGVRIQSCNILRKEEGCGGTGYGMAGLWRHWVPDGRAAYEDFGRKDTVLQHTAEGGGLWRHWVGDGRAAYEDFGRKDTVLQHTAEGGGLWRH